MTKSFNAFYFGTFASMSWGLVAIPWSRGLDWTFIFLAGGLAFVTTFVAGWFVPCDAFSKKGWTGWFLAVLSTLCVTIGCIVVAVFLFHAFVLTAKLDGLFGNTLYDIRLVVATLFVFPVSSVFWVIATSLLWWLNTRHAKKYSVGS